MAKFCKAVQFSCSITSDSLGPHGLQHARLPCLSLSPKVCSNSCPLSQQCHPTISSSVIPFSCPQSFPASGSFPMSQFFASGGQRIGASALASVFPMSIQGRFPLGLTGLISLLSKGLSGVFSSTTIWKHQFFRTQPSLRSNSHIQTWLLEKKHSFDKITWASYLIPLCLIFLVWKMGTNATHFASLYMQEPSMALACEGQSTESRGERRG